MHYLLATLLILPLSVVQPSSSLNDTIDNTSNAATTLQPNTETPPTDTFAEEDDDDEPDCV